MELRVRPSPSAPLLAGPLPSALPRGADRPGCVGWRRRRYGQISRHRGVAGEADAFRRRPGPSGECAIEGRPGPRRATSLPAPLHLRPSPLEPRPRGRPTGGPARRRRGRTGGKPAGISAPDAATLPPRLSARRSQYSARPPTRRRPFTFRVRHVAPHSVRAAWDTAEEASTDSRRPQAAPLSPAHLCDAQCAPRRGAVGAGPGSGSTARGARGPPAQFHWLGCPPAPAAVARPRVRLEPRPALGCPGWRRMRSPPRWSVTCGRGPGPRSPTFVGFNTGLGTRASREHSVKQQLIASFRRPFKVGYRISPD